MNLPAIPQGYAEAQHYQINPGHTKPAHARVVADGGDKKELWTTGQLLVFLAANAPHPVELRAEAGDSLLLECLCAMSANRELFRAGGLWWKVVRIGVIETGDAVEVDVVMAPLRVNA